MMGFTRKQADAWGIGHRFPASAGKNQIPVIVPPAKSKAPDDGLNKLERAFWERLQDAERMRVFEKTYEHPFKLRVIGNRYYIPDFASTEPDVAYVTIWETKGFMREDAELKLIAAAERYPCFEWVLVQKIRRKWECRFVTARGKDREIWCPEWLR